MSQIPVQNGVRVKDGAFQIAHPVNLHHKLVESGVSKGELVHTRGAREIGTGPGINRGGIEWNGIHYRVMGDQFGAVGSDGTFTAIGSVGSDGLAVGFALGFDRMAIRSATNLFYYDGTSLAQITDPGLGPSIDVTWIDSYFVSTDGTSVVTDQLNAPTTFPNYGSAEFDPDSITGLGVLNEDLAIFGRYTIQFHRNVGGAGYPFQNIAGATISFGCISAQAKCRIAGTYAFVGGARNEPLGVFIITNGVAARVSDEEIDRLLADCSDQNEIALEARQFGDEQHLILHAGDASAALAMKASADAGSGLWHRLAGKNGGTYRPRDCVYLGGVYYVGDCSGPAIGVLEKGIATQFGDEVPWQFDAGMIYADGNSLILHEIELRGQFPTAPTAIFFSLTRDGETWSKEAARRTTGRRDERMVWRPNVRCGPLAGLRFRGFGRVSIARCDADGEILG